MKESGNSTARGLITLLQTAGRRRVKRLHQTDTSDKVLPATMTRMRVVVSKKSVSFERNANSVLSIVGYSSATSRWKTHLVRYQAAQCAGSGACRLREDPDGFAQKTHIPRRIPKTSQIAD